MIATLNIKAQKIPSDSIPNLSLQELNLTVEQKLAIKQLIGEYKLQESLRRRELRRRIFILLNSNQQHTVRKFWRAHLRK